MALLQNMGHWCSRSMLGPKKMDPKPKRHVLIHVLNGNCISFISNLPNKTRPIQMSLLLAIARMLCATLSLESRSIPLLPATNSGGETLTCNLPPAQPSHQYKADKKRILNSLVSHKFSKSPNWRSRNSTQPKMPAASKSLRRLWINLALS